MNKASKNYFFNLATFFPFVFLLLTGIFVLRYHGGTDYKNLTLGIDGNTWLKIHHITALVILPFITVHLWLHAHWIKSLAKLKLKGRNSGMNLTLFIIFMLCLITGLLAWQVFKDSKLGEVLREVHSKLGLLLIFFFLVHMSNYFKWLVRMTRKHLGMDK